MRCTPFYKLNTLTQGSSAQAGSKRRAKGRASLSAGETVALPSWIFLGTVVWTMCQLTGDLVNGVWGARVCLPHDTFNACCLFHPGLQDS